MSDPEGRATRDGRHADIGGRATDLRNAIDRAIVAAQRLQKRPVNEVLGVIDRIVAKWLSPDFPLRGQAEAELPGATGFSSEMIRHGLSLQLEPLRGAAIGALLDAELGSRQALDEGYSGRRARGPNLIAHILAGNIPALAAAPVLLSLALKSAVLVKPAAGEPIFAPLLHASIAEVDPELAACVIVSGWRGGEAAFEDVAFRIADVVVASGSDAAIAAIEPRVRGKFIGHGHRVSFALVGRDCLATSADAAAVAERLAYDVSLWDQQGCLSPQLCYVELGGAVSLNEFADLVAKALEHYAVDLPPRLRSFAEQTAILRFRQEAEWQPDGRLLASVGSAAWSISVDSAPAFLPTCLNRCVRLKSLDNLTQLGPLIEPHRSLLEAAGIAVSEGREGEMRTLLASACVPYVCRLGTMQTPTLSWRPSGRPRVADWVTL